MLALYASALSAFHPHYAPPIAASIQKWDLNVLREQVRLRIRYTLVAGTLRK